MTQAMYCMYVKNTKIDTKEQKNMAATRESETDEGMGQRKKSRAGDQSEMSGGCCCLRKLYYYVEVCSICITTARDKVDAVDAGMLAKKTLESVENCTIPHF